MANNTTEEMMFDRQFMQTKLSKAAAVSTFVMAAFVALSSQIQATPAHAAQACPAIEMACGHLELA